MGLTVTNTNTISLLGQLTKIQRNQSNTLTQLTTGYRINRGADDPAGLISLKGLQAELASVDSAINNNQKTDAVLNVADSAIGEIHSLLTEIQSLVTASTSDANLSSSEKAANQSQIDQAIDSIDRIVRTTSFNGKKLLDGTGAIRTTVADSSKIKDLKIYSRGNISSDLALTVAVTTAADEATFNFGTVSTGATSGALEVTLTGTLGTATIELATGQSALYIKSAINAQKDLTGVSAVVSGAGAARAVALYSTTTGSDAFISVDIISGGGITASGDLRETNGKVYGIDARGTINGAVFTADGSKVSFSLNGASGDFELASNFTSGNSTFTVSSSSGGFTFQLGTDTNTRQTIGIDALYANLLGSADAGGFLNELKSGGDADLTSASSRATALNVLSAAINDVSVAQGRIGAFQKFQVQPALNTLNVTKTSLSDAASIIGDTDYAKATADLNKQSVLLNSSISLLGLANQQSAQILSLLG